MPSQEFRRQYEASAGRVRAFAWVGLSVGAAGVGSGVALLLVSKSKADDLRPRLRAYNRNPETRTSALAASLANERETIATLDALTLVGGLVGLAGLGAGLTLYLVGDDPDRFEATVNLAPGAAASSRAVRVIAWPGGVSVVGEL